MNNHFYHIFDQDWVERLGARAARAEAILNMAPEEVTLKITSNEILVDDVLIAERVDIPDDFYK